MTLGFLKTEKYTDEGKRLGVYDPDNKLCVLVASSPSWHRDFNNFNNKFQDIQYDIFAINKALSRIKNVKHWCSLHPRCNTDAGWDKIRIEQGWDNNFKTHAPRIPSDKLKEQQWTHLIDYIWNVSIRRGSSSLFGVSVAMGMGYSGVVVCGVELLGGYHRYLAKWKQFANVFRGFVRCQSGTLRVSMGHPTEAWINNKTGD